VEPSWNHRGTIVDARASLAYAAAMALPRIALATCAALPDLDTDDQPLQRALQARGATVTTPVWDGPRAAFGPDAIDLVVIRNTWDYTTRKDAFLAFVDDVASQVPLLNPPAVLRDNTDKRYLQRLGDDGIPTVPTVFVEQGSAGVVFDDVVSRLPAASGWVIKPRVGAGSRNTIKVDNTAAGRSTATAFLQTVLPGEGLMVQPFLPRISDGEASLVFFNGLFSHAVLKRPAVGDFRSQPDFGGRVTPLTPTSAQRTVADAVIAAFGRANLLYARIDLVVGLDGHPALIEAELCEPSLYLGWDEAAVDRCADAILARVGNA
jgi:glutathione synthase/RimK-type ligase-like ATP-grasp enzyme